VPALISLIRVGADPVARANAAACLANLATEAHNRRLIVVSEGIPPILTLLRCTEERTRRKAVAALLNLSMDHDNQRAIVREGAVQELVEVLKGTLDASLVLRSEVATVIRYLSLPSENLRAVASHGAIPPLCQFLLDATDDGKANAAAALGVLSVDPSNASDIVACDAIPPLISLVKFGNDRGKTHAATTLWNLAATPSISELVLHAGAVPPLVALLRSGQERPRACAARALQNLAIDSVECTQQIMDCGGVPPALDLLALDDEDGQTVAAGLLWNLTLDQRALPPLSAAIPKLVSIIQAGTIDARINAMGALRGLCHAARGRRAIAEEGALPHLVELAHNGTEPEREKAAACLRVLATGSSAPSAQDDGGGTGTGAGTGTGGGTGGTGGGGASGDAAVAKRNRRVIADAGGAGVLLDVLRTGTDKGKGYAATALLALANDADTRPRVEACGEDAVAEVLAACEALQGGATPGGGAAPGPDGDASRAQRRRHLEGLAAQLGGLPVGRWSTDHVCAWASACPDEAVRGMEPYLLAALVTGEEIARLGRADAETWDTLGISDAGRKEALQRAIAAIAAPRE
jgi:uncharacterized membrane protein YgcG